MVLIWYHADMSRKLSFSGQMRARLRSFRIAAKLTQDELALRMGYSGANRRRLVERLENGRIAEPTVRMTARHLQGCGASCAAGAAQDT
jgi:transcriptional regulator with XRE-family HTH domain